MLQAWLGLFGIMLATWLNYPLVQAIFSGLLIRNNIPVKPMDEVYCVGYFLLGIIMRASMAHALLSPFVQDKYFELAHILWWLLVTITTLDAVNLLDKAELAQRNPKLMIFWHVQHLRDMWMVPAHCWYPLVQLVTVLGGSVAMMFLN